MTNNRETSKVKPKTADLKIEVVNPRYEGATVEMVVKAMLQRPRKEKKAKDEKPETG